MNTNQHTGQLLIANQEVTQAKPKMNRLQGNMPPSDQFGKIVHVDDPCLFIHKDYGIIITIKEIPDRAFTQTSFVPVISTDELALELEQLNQVTV